MKTKAVRLYGQEDIRLEEFELPPIKEDEILAEVVTDSLCMSSYKAAIQGEKHKKVPEDINENPIILGHEFCGVILSVGEKWKEHRDEKWFCSGVFLSLCRGRRHKDRADESDHGKRFSFEIQRGVLL